MGSRARCRRMRLGHRGHLRLTNRMRMNRQQPDTSGVLDSIEVRELTPQLVQRLGVPADVRGVVVAQVGRRSTEDSCGPVM